ncbi:S-layer homology domain-containing protein [Lysinibacillus sphaericus]|uniref:S-layer homology domain-containing protein n=1 Tax=Lysinibacillus sphaericus TaxID=1421 RepID=UPI002DB7211C|nr:S-layer homology domain-containing protein [Lysinibacillus sphaericus]MEB7452746.1 S-layer homology domain-containing protein [Lysinibacillus sphaericus]
MNRSQAFKNGRNGIKMVRKKMRFYVRILIVLILMMASIGYIPAIEVEAAVNGTADGTYDFGGSVSGDNSAGAGFSTFSDKFIISNGFAVDPATSQLYTQNYTPKAQETLIIKAEGGNICKTFTFKDLGISIVPDLPKLTFSKLSLVVKDTNGATLGSHSIANKEISGNGMIYQLSTLLNNGNEFDYNGAESLEITWQFDFPTNDPNTEPSNLNFDNITIANVSDSFSDTQTPTISNKTITSSNVSTTGVTLGWEKATDDVTLQGDLEYRVYQSSSNNMDTVSDIEVNGLALGTGFSKDLEVFNVTGLLPSTTYYFNVIVKDAAGNKSAYTMKSVTTSIPANAPTVTTNTIPSNVTTTGATVGGYVTADGGAIVTERGIVYATTANPTTINSKITITGTTGTFTADLSGLNPNTTYHYRAYATNSVGTSYGSDQTFTTGSLSNNADLSNLTLSTGTLSPAFASGTTDYTANVASNVGNIQVTPTLADSYATLTLNGAAVTSGIGKDIALNVGLNTITIIVTAQNQTTKIYTITVTRAAPTYTIDTISNQMFPALTAGYTSGTQETKTLTIANTGTGSLANVSVAISGANADDFDITQPSATSLPSAGNTIFTVRAKDGLAVGTYTATVTVSATNLTPVTFTVTQEVQANSVTAPDVPTNVLATPGDSYVRVSFDVPTNNGGSTITGYTVKVYVGGVEQPMLAKIGTLSPIIVTGLTNGTAYTFKVLATNIAGNSGESMASNVVTPVAPTAPGQPTIPVPTPSSPTTSTKIQVGLEIDGDNPLEKTTIEIERTKHANGEITDFVALTESSAKAAIEKAKQIDNNIVRIVLPDVNDEIDKVTVEVPKQSLQLLRENGLSLEIATENGLVTIPHSSMKGIEDNFYFRLVPVKKNSERQAIEERARVERVVHEALESNNVHVVARPMTIETNMPNRPVHVTLPLKGVKIPVNIVERKAFLKQLAIFIEHSDGEKKVVLPEVVTMVKGELGLRFTVEKFSTFTIIQVNRTKPPLEVNKHEAYINGFLDGTFGPEKNVTRGQVAMMIARILGYTDGTVDTTPLFRDIPSDYYAAGPIAFIKERGIMNGDIYGNFRASDNITRAEMATVVANFKQLHIEENQNITFKDTKGHWAQWIIEAIRAAGIINGQSDGSFAPNEPVTRAQAIVMMNRMLERGPLQGVTSPSFQDVKETHWAFEEIEEAAKTHTYVIDQDGNEKLSK